MLQLLLIVPILFLTTTLYYTFKDFTTRFTKGYKLAQLLPGPKIYPLCGSVWILFNKTPEQIFNINRSLALIYKKSYRFWFLGKLFFNIIEPRHAEIILSSSKYNTKGYIYEALTPFLGSGLLCSNGPKWHQRRKILTPAFHFSILTNDFFRVFKDESNCLVETIQQLQDESIDGVAVHPVMTQITLNIINETAMGIKINSMDEPDKYRQKIQTIGELLLQRMMQPWLSSSIVAFVTGYSQRLSSNLKPVHAFTRGVIQKRKMAMHTEKEDETGQPKTRNNLLDILLSAKRHGVDIDDEGIREEVDVFMYGGHDTTSSCLESLFLVLSNHPTVQASVYNEIQAQTELTSEISLEQISNLKYLDCVIKETMRMYPPVPFYSRQIEEPVTIDENTLPTGTICNLFVYDIHHNSEDFPNPDIFDPDRFQPENIAKRHRFAFLPFSAGPRNCIGQKYALLEIKTIVATVLKCFALEAVTKIEDVKFSADLVLRPVNHVRVKFIKRN